MSDNIGENQKEDVVDKKNNKNKKFFLFTIFFALIVIFLGTVFSIFQTPNPKEKSKLLEQQVEKARQGMDAPPSYNNLVEDSNKARAQRAEEKGGSAVATPVLNSVDIKCDECEKRLSGILGENEKLRKNIEKLERDIAFLRNQQQKGQQKVSYGYEKYYDKDSKVLFQTEKSYVEERKKVYDVANNFVAIWDKAPGIARTMVETHRDSGTGGGASVRNESEGNCGAGGCEGLPSGDILYATLLTGINSDVPGTPIVAEVKTGKLTGARLIGKFISKDDYIVLQFQTGTTKDGKSFRLNGYAIDAGTRFAGIADDVDHHYFLKYGALLGAAFLQGYGEIVKESLKKVQYYPTVYTGSSSIGAGGAYTESTPIETVEADTKEAMTGALATVGQELANQLRKAADRPPTITIYPGSDIGVLLVEPIYFAH
jgi:intracellular multiplication protein IcmE